MVERMTWVYVIALLLQELTLFEAMTRIRAANFGFESAWKITIGKARIGRCVGIEQPDGLGAGGQILRHLQWQVGRAIAW